MIETLEQAQGVIDRIAYPNTEFVVKEQHIGTFVVTARLTAPDITLLQDQVTLVMSTSITPGKTEFQFASAVFRLAARLAMHEFCEQFLLDGERFQNTHIESDLLRAML